MQSIKTLSFALKFSNSDDNWNINLSRIKLSFRLYHTPILAFIWTLSCSNVIASNVAYDDLHFRLAAQLTAYSIQKFHFSIKPQPTAYQDLFLQPILNLISGLQSSSSGYE